MKIFLVNPACLDVRITDDDAMTVPMGLYYIASLMMESGFEIKIVNLAPLSEPLDHLVKITVDEKPDIIGFSLLNANRHCAIDGAGAVKKINPDIHIVFGGPAPTFEPHYFFRACPQLDYIVRGEGEETFLELASYLRKRSQERCSLNLQQRGELKTDPQVIDRLKEIRGLVFRSDYPYAEEPSIVETPSRVLISDLDTLPHPAKEFDFEHISLSRGCPGRCTFCGSPHFWGESRVRFHSAKWFVDEIELLNNRGRSHFFISDDTFTMRKNLVIEVCQEIISRFVKRGIKITWSAISRVDFIDEEILFNMRKAGCIQISFGVESGSEEIRRRLGKPFRNETIIRAFQLTASFGILPRAYFIYGSPGETKESIGKSIELMREIAPLAMVSYMLVLFPGTALYKHASDLIARSFSKGEKKSIWDHKIEDIPWFEIDPDLSFQQVRGFGEALRNAFYSAVQNFALSVRLVDSKELYPYHADFLSRLAMTFSHGDYALNPKMEHQEITARTLYERALFYAPDPRAYLGLAMLLQKHKDFKGAVSVIKEAFEQIGSDENLDNSSLAMAGWDITVKRQLTLCMAVSLMNMAQFRDAISYLEPFSQDDVVKPYIQICQSRI